MYHLSKAFIRRRKDGITDDGRTTDVENRSFLVEAVEGSEHKNFKRQRKLHGMEMLLANIKLYDKGSVEVSLQNKLMYSKKRKVGNSILNTTTIQKTEKIERKSYLLMTKSMKNKYKESVFETKKKLREDQNKRDKVFGFKTKLKLSKSQDFKGFQNVDENSNIKDGEIFLGSPIPLNRNHSVHPTFFSTPFHDQNERLNINRRMSRQFERPSYNSRSRQGQDRSRELNTSSHQHSTSGNTKINSMTKISQAEFSKSIDESLPMRFDMPKPSRFSIRRRVNVSLDGRTTTSKFAPSIDDHIELRLSQKPIPVLETTEGKLYSICYMVSDLLEQCKDTNVPYARLCHIFADIEGEQEMELRKVFSHYSSVPKYHPLELCRIVKTGWIRPLFLGYKLSFLLPADDPVLEIQNRRTFMLKLDELKERLQTINLESRQAIFKQNLTIINKAVEAIEKPMPIILSDPSDLFNDINKARIAKLELSDIKATYNINLMRNKSISSMIDEYESRGIHVKLPFVDKDIISQNDMIYKLKKNLKLVPK
jgi:hypothetical protein